MRTLASQRFTEHPPTSTVATSTSDATGTGPESGPAAYRSLPCNGDESRRATLHARTAASGRHDAGVTTAAPHPSAPAGALRFSSDARPGIARRRAGRGFSYRRPDGRRCVTARPWLASVRSPSRPPGPTSGSASIRSATSRPPAATPAAASNTATTRSWRRRRDDAKYERWWSSAAPCRGSARGSRRDLRRAGLPRDRVLALLVRLLETTLIRVGNDEYARRTTILRPDHAARAGTCASRRRAALPVSRQERQGPRGRRRGPAPGAHRGALPGTAGPGAVPVSRRGRGAARGRIRRRQRLSPRRRRHRRSPPRTSAPGQGPCSRFGALRSASDPDAPATKRTVTRSTEVVAEALGNTAAVTRGSYIAPAVIDALPRRIASSQAGSRAAGQQGGNWLHARLPSRRAGAHQVAGCGRANQEAVRPPRLIALADGRAAGPEHARPDDPPGPRLREARRSLTRGRRPARRYRMAQPSNASGRGTTARSSCGTASTGCTSARGLRPQKHAGAGVTDPAPGPAVDPIAAATAARWDLPASWPPSTDEDLDRDPGGGEWTIRQTLGHVVEVQRAYAWIRPGGSASGTSRVPAARPDEINALLPGRGGHGAGPSARSGPA